MDAKPGLDAKCPMPTLTAYDVSCIQTRDAYLDPGPTPPLLTIMFLRFLS